MKKLPVHLARRPVEDRVGGVGHDLGRAAIGRHRVAAEQLRTAAVSIAVSGHSA